MSGPTFGPPTSQVAVAAGVVASFRPSSGSCTHASHVASPAFERSLHQLPRRCPACQSDAGQGHGARPSVQIESCSRARPAPRAKAKARRLAISGPRRRCSDLDRSLPFMAHDVARAARRVAGQVLGHGRRRRSPRLAHGSARDRDGPRRSRPRPLVLAHLVMSARRLDGDPAAVELRCPCRSRGLRHATSPESQDEMRRGGAVDPRLTESNCPLTSASRLMRTWRRTSYLAIFLARRPPDPPASLVTGQVREVASKRDPRRRRPRHPAALLRGLREAGFQARRIRSSSPARAARLRLKPVGPVSREDAALGQGHRLQWASTEAFRRPIASDRSSPPLRSRAPRHAGKLFVAAVVGPPPRR